jgi:hypothetical protein
MEALMDTRVRAYRLMQYMEQALDFYGQRAQFAQAFTLHMALCELERGGDMSMIKDLLQEFDLEDDEFTIFLFDESDDEREIDVEDSEDDSNPEGVA